MLFKQRDLDQIKNGEISVAFRKWKKPRVKKDTLLKTSIGLIRIIEISKTRLDLISTGDLQRAGHSSLEALKKLIENREGDIFKISLKYFGPDPRIELRNNTDISDIEIETILTKLKKLDLYSRRGAWTQRVLTSIKEKPELRAKDLAVLLGEEKEWLKLNVRKLKNLGLTVSLKTGYCISPRGEVILNKLNQ